MCGGHHLLLPCAAVATMHHSLIITPTKLCFFCWARKVALLQPTRNTRHGAKVSVVSFEFRYYIPTVEVNI